MKISASPGKRNKVHISVDGEYRFTVDGEYWYSCPWCGKAEIKGEKEKEKFYSDIGSRSVFIAALGILSYGDNSRKTLQSKLIRKGCDREHITAALDKLEEYGYVNDARYAANLAERLLSSKHMSRSAIKQELIAKGVERELAAEAADALECDPSEELDTLLTSKYRRYLGDEKGIKKTVAALRRLGYGWSDIKSALDRAGVEKEDESL